MKKNITEIKKIIQKYPKIYYSMFFVKNFLEIYSGIIPRTLRYYISKFKKTIQKPTVLQLPITYKCNFDCVMCGMKKMIAKNDFSPEELIKIIDDPLFSSVKSVGVNGGEPFIKNNLKEYITILVEKLPKLENIYIITNGYFTDKILQQLGIIKTICNKKNIKVNLSISVDGVNDIQDLMRGKTNSFGNAVNTFSKINENIDKYCDKLNVICTITKLNIQYINEVDVWAAKNDANIIYNIATIHKRIYNEDRFENFSIFTDEKARCLTSEFFYSKFLELKSERYFALYMYAKNNTRLSICQYQTEGVTVTPNGQLSFCATYSDEIGDVINSSAIKVFNNNLGHLNEIKANHCQTCSHYIESLNLRGYILMCNELFRASTLPLKYYW